MSAVLVALSLVVTAGLVDPPGGDARPFRAPSDVCSGAVAEADDALKPLPAATTLGPASPWITAAVIGTDPVRVRVGAAASLLGPSRRLPPEILARGRLPDPG